MLSQDQTVAEKVRDFYTEVAKKCEFTTNVNNYHLSDEHKELVKKVHNETMRRYYGSGFMIPEKIEGVRILDIGCGSGSYVFILSKLVGKDGHVVGIDIIPDLILLCKEYSRYHSEMWGYLAPNFEFLCGNAETMAREFDFLPGSFDVIVSNGVFCLLGDKAKVFAEAYKLLKEGGEFLLSDVYAEQPAPEDCKDDLKMWNLGLTGSQVWPQLDSFAQAAGFTRPYLTMAGPIDVSEEYKTKVRGGRYCSAGNRLFKLPKGAHRGPAQVTYKGDIKGCEKTLKWDVSLTFEAGKPVDVDAELATILFYSRFKTSFDFKDIPSAKSNRVQNPFTYIDEQTKKGNPVPFSYRVE
ncbi:arsenite methyltransferase-like [Gigantopelta aegis]|uniref:arsenite methyltransferase-like n=1 Tax=Gigantopelta aegis TaxID=1735272 RepID=UPI001B888A28|nr:arsenite methyltransferase-like [Gigantopelta aegis]XP_041363662.1 arsenite methyltransferase-like [Gigantopelta aegis]XP_041363663.1 arsenite methyltransferase-like [Gigantopelta aegis]XP_041363664.1 arsenite methyltransferase-like [Gigantopelta aegis]